MLRLLSLGIIVVCLFGIGIVSLGLLAGHPGTRAVRQRVVRELTFFMSEQGRRFPFIPLPPRHAKLDSLVQPFFAQKQGTYAVVVEDLDFGFRSSVNDALIMQSASLYKLFVMAAWFDRYDVGGAVMDDETKQSIERMIVISSNADGETLGARYGWDNVTTWAKENGFHDTTLTSIPPMTSARNVAQFFRKLAAGEIVSRNASLAMMEILRLQTINDRIPANLPEGVRVAHKTGEWGGILHDAGIVEAPHRTYIIVLMAKDVGNVAQAKETMAEFSRKVFDLLGNQSQATEIL